MVDYFKIEQSPPSLKTLPATSMKVALFAKSVGGLEIECDAFFVSGRLIEEVERVRKVMSICSRV